MQEGSTNCPEHLARTQSKETASYIGFQAGSSQLMASV